ncbi:fibronectin type III domain-containing protein [Candidatus Mycoplasma pogonae]
MSNLKDKKILLGIAGLTLTGVAVVGSLLGAEALRNDILERQLQALKDGRKASVNLLESEKISAKSGVSVDENLSYTSPQEVKIVFNIPNELTGKTLTLFYQEFDIKKPQSIVLTTQKAATNIGTTKVSFLIKNLPSSNEIYQYQLMDNSAPQADQIIYFSQFKTETLPELSAEGVYRGANVNISKLNDYQSRSLELRAVERSEYLTKGMLAFKDSLLLQKLNVKEGEDEIKNLWFKPVGEGVLKDNTEYSLMLLDKNGLLPVIASPVTFTTKVNNVITTASRVKTREAEINLQNLLPYQGKKLVVVYAPLDNKDTIFLTNGLLANFKKEIQVPTFEDPQKADLTLVLNNLEPNQNYKLQIYALLDKELTDPFLAEPVWFKTKAQPVVESVVEGLPNPGLEAHAAHIKISDVSEYTLTDLKLKYKPQSDTTPWKDITDEVAVNVEQGEAFAASTIKNLKANTTYTYQLFWTPATTSTTTSVAGTTPAPVDTTALALFNGDQRFTTKAGFTKSSLNINVPLGNDGKTTATVDIKSADLAQYYIENSGNSIEFRYGEAKADSTDAEGKSVPQFINFTDHSSSDFQTVTTKIIKKTDGTFALEKAFTLTLSANKKYEYAIFVGPNKIASNLVTPEFLLSREDVTTTVAPLDKKAILYTNALKSYAGLKYRVAVKESAAQADVAPTVFGSGTVAEDGIVTATLGEGSSLLKPSTSYKYDIVMIQGDQEVVINNGTFTTKANAFGALSIPATSVYPTSLTVTVPATSTLLETSLKLVVVYRPKGSTDAWIVSPNSQTVSASTTNFIVNKLTPVKEYEFNVALEGAPQHVLAESVFATTKNNVVVTTSEPQQRGFTINFAEINEYKAKTLTVKVWKATDKKDALKNNLPTNSSEVLFTKTLTIKTENDITVADPVVVTNIDPQETYVVQLFDGNHAVSVLQLQETLPQVKVAKINRYLNAANIFFTDLQTIENKESELKVVVAKGTTDNFSPTSNSANLKEFAFKVVDNKNEQQLLVSGLEKNTDYVVQLFKKSDTRNTNPLITTSLTVSGARKFKTLEATELPEVSVVAVGHATATIKVSKLADFKGQKLVFKYRPNFWQWTNQREFEFTVPTEMPTPAPAPTAAGTSTSSTGTGTSSGTAPATAAVATEIFVKFALSNLGPLDKNRADTQTWFYEIYVDVDGNKDKVKLLGDATSTDLESNKFISSASKPGVHQFTTMANPRLAPETVKVATTEAKMKFRFPGRTSSTTSQKFYVKAFPKPAGADQINWKSNDGSVVSAKVDVTDNTLKEFTLNTTSGSTTTDNSLKPSTDYLFQLFLEGSDEPLLVEAGEFKTLPSLNVVTKYLTNTTWNLLLENAHQYAGKTLVVELEKETTTSGTTSWTAVADKKETLTIQANTNAKSNYNVPVLFTGLDPNTKYRVKVSLKDTDLASVNLSSKQLEGKTEKNIAVAFHAASTNSLDGVELILSGESLAALKNVPLTMYYKVGTTKSELNQIDSTFGKIDFTIPSDFTETNFKLPENMKIGESGDYWVYLLRNNSKDANLLGNPSPYTKIVNKTLDVKGGEVKSGKTLNEILPSYITDKTKLEEILNNFTVDGYTVSFASKEEGGVFVADDNAGTLIYMLKMVPTASTSETDSSSSKPILLIMPLTGMKKETSTTPAPATTTS